MESTFIFSMSQEEAVSWIKKKIVELIRKNSITEKQLRKLLKMRFGAKSVDEIEYDGLYDLVCELEKYSDTTFKVPKEKRRIINLMRMLVGTTSTARNNAASEIIKDKDKSVFEIKSMVINGLVILRYIDSLKSRQAISEITQIIDENFKNSRLMR